MIRFLHTADWQLGMTRHFFSEGVQERYTQSRFDAIRRLGQIAKEKDCEFMLVCGDTFESNQVDRQTVARTCEALRDVSVPVYILPANHDPLDSGSVYQSNTFVDKKPDQVIIIENFGPLVATPGVEIVGAPWKSKKPATNPLEELLDLLSPIEGTIRIVAGHGIVDLFTPDKEAPAIINVSKLEAAVNEGKASFIALGDRHSATKLGETDRIYYSGTPVSTDFREDNSGKALIVELDSNKVLIQGITVGDWDFVEMEQVDLNHADDVANLDRTLQAMESKERKVVRLRLFGGLTLTLNAQLQNVLQTAGDLFAGFDVREDNLVILPEDADFADLSFSGFADKTVERLRKQIEGNGTDAGEARDALMLLVRLAKGAA